MAKETGFGKGHNLKGPGPKKFTAWDPKRKKFRTFTPAGYKKATGK